MHIDFEFADCSLNRYGHYADSYHGDNYSAGEGYGGYDGDGYGYGYGYGDDDGDSHDSHSKSPYAIYNHGN